MCDYPTHLNALCDTPSFKWHCSVLGFFFLQYVWETFELRKVKATIISHFSVLHGDLILYPPHKGQSCLVVFPADVFESMNQQ